MEKNFKEIIILLVSVLLLIDGVDNTFENLLGVVLAFMIFDNPLLYVPLMWVSSWHSRLTVFPNVGALFFYGLLFLLSSIHNKNFINYSFHRCNIFTYGFLLIVWIILTLSTSVSPEYADVFKLCIYISFSLLILKYKIYDIGIINNSLIMISLLATLIFGIRILTAPFQFVVETYHSWGMTSLSSNTVLPELNPNSAAQIIVLISFIIISELLRTRKILLLVPLLINANTLLLLGSRTSFFTLLIVFSIHFLFFADISFIKKIAMSFIALIIILVSSLFLDEFVSNSRIVNDSIFADEGSGRFVNWYALISDIFPSHYIAGIGIGRSGYSILGFSFDADNMYIDLLCQIGMVGFIIYSLIYISTFRDSHFMKKSYISYPDYSFMFLLSFLFFGIGETIFNTSIFWITLMLIFLCNNYYKTNYDII